MLQFSAMPPQAVEIDVLINIGVLLGEIGAAVEDYATSVRETAVQGIAPAVELPDLEALTAAWNEVGSAMARMSETSDVPAEPRASLTSIEAGLATVLDIVQRQADDEGEDE
jgi:hypothetical protein